MFPIVPFKTHLTEIEVVCSMQEVSTKAVVEMKAQR